MAVFEHLIVLGAGAIGSVYAAKLAVRHDVDLHLAADLLRQGCSVELALEILL